MAYEPLVIWDIGKVVMQCVQHWYVGGIPLLLPLRIDTPGKTKPISDENERDQRTSALQSRTNCFNVLRSLSISKSPGLSTFFCFFGGFGPSIFGWL